MPWTRSLPRSVWAKLSSITSSPYWSKLSQAKWVILGIALTISLLSHFGFLDHFETAGLDTFNILKAPKDPSHVVIIAINEEDYKSTFNETSPLKTSELQRILAAIARGHPKVIGVDIDTSSELSKDIETPDDWPAVVWGRDAIWDEHSKTFQVQPVLGGRDPARNRDAAAIAQLPLDTDGIVRRYRRELPIEGNGKKPSFPWAVVEAACLEPNPVKGCGEVKKEIESRRGLVLNFAGERFSFTPVSAHFIVQAAEHGGWESDSPIRDKIVLLGGYYRAARDTQITPVGPMAGVQLMAQAIETEFSGGGIRPLNEFVAILLDLFAGALLVFISYRYAHRLRKALLLSLLVLVVLPLISSFIAFSTLARWFNFVPLIAGVLVHELYEHAREYHDLRRKYLKEEETHTSRVPSEGAAPVDAASAQENSQSAA